MKFSHLSSAELTDIGKKRGNNEDAVLRMDERGVFCVADGMGGAEAGEVASLAVVEALKEAFSDRHATGDEPLEQARRLVREAVVNANAWIHDYGRSHDAAGIGSTAVIMVFDRYNPQQALVMHAGDSRAYRLRDSAMKRLTRDHSLAAEAGVDDETRLGPMFQSMVTRAVGVQLTVDLEETPVDVRTGDLFLICSDGLTRMLPDNELSVLLAENRNLPLDGLAQLLVDEANEKGGHDNISVVLIRAADLPAATEAPAPAPARAETPAGPARAVTEEPTPERPGTDEPPRRDSARTDEPDTPMEPDSSEPIEDSQEADAPSDDLEGDTPPEQLSPTPAAEKAPAEPEAAPGPSPAATPEPEEPAFTPQPEPAAQPAATPAEKTASWHAWAVASAIVAVLVAGALIVVHHERHGRARVMPPEPVIQEPGDDSQQAARPPAEAKPVPPPAPAPAPRPAPAPQAPVLPDRDIATMRATLPTKIEGTLMTGEWGDMEAHVLKWSRTIESYLARSGRETLYARWLAQWKKVQGGQTDPAEYCAEYRAAVAAVCAHAGSQAPPDEKVNWNASPAERADACCRTQYLMQKHLTSTVEQFSENAAGEQDVLGDAPSDTLDALSRFVGRTDDELARCKAAVKDIRGDTGKLEMWLTACGDNPIPVESIRMAPGTVIPRIKASLQVQRAAVANRLALIPAALASRSTTRDLPAADLAAIRDMHAKIAAQNPALPAFWSKASCRDDARMLMARVRNMMNQAARRPAGDQARGSP